MTRFCLTCLCASLVGSSIAWTASAQDAIEGSTADSTGEPTAQAEGGAPIAAAPSASAHERADFLGAPTATASDSVAPTTATAQPAAPTLTAIAEVSIGTTPTLGFGLGGVSGAGALASLEGFGFGGRTDFAFAASPRVFFGLGLNVTHHKIARTESVGGETANRLSVPLIAQIYLDTPRLGATVPTVRVTPALRWANQVRETFDGIAFRTTRTGSLGGQLELGIGITWFIVEALAIRILGDVGLSADFSTAGPKANDVSAYVGADIGVVVRL